MLKTDNLNQGYRPKQTNFSNETNVNLLMKTAEPIQRTRINLRNEFQSILLKIDDVNDWISFIFLVCDEATLVYEGYQLINKLLQNNIQAVISVIAKSLMRNQHGSLDAAFDPMIEALYYIGHHDILEDQLGLCSEHDIDSVCKNLSSISPDRIDLYKVFSEISQEKANEIIATSLPLWLPHNLDETFEHIFIRNLNRISYVQMLTDVYYVLDLENNSLATILRPYINIHDIDCLEENTREAAAPNLYQVDRGIPLDPNEYYPMPTCEPHGLCVIINVKNFLPPTNPNDQLNLDPRLGSDVDKVRLRGTFKLFGFEVMTIDDPTKNDLENLFKIFRTNGRLWAAKCLAVCIMTHGDDYDQIYLSDREPLSVSDLRKLCYSTAMIGKPKLYFIQACRGEGRLRPMMVQRDATHASNSETDCLLAQATVSGYSAIRSQSSGTWFITDLCTSLQEYGHCSPLKTVLRKTKLKLNERVETLDGKYVTQASEDIDTLTKEVQFKRAGLSTYLDGIVDLALIEIQEEIIDLLIEEVEREVPTTIALRKFLGI